MRGDLEALQVLLDLSWAKAGHGAKTVWERTDRMTAGQFISFLADQRYCAIATTGSQGSPHLVPVSFLNPADGTFWLPTVDGSLRLRTILWNPRAAVVVGQGLAGSRTVVVARGAVGAVASSEIPAAVREQAQAKLGDTAWAAGWLVLRPEAGAGVLRCKLRPRVTYFIQGRHSCQISRSSARFGPGRSKFSVPSLSDPACGGWQCRCAAAAT